MKSRSFTSPLLSVALSFGLLLANIGLSSQSIAATKSLSWSKVTTGKYNNTFDCPFKKVSFKYDAKAGSATFDLQFYPNHCNQEALAGNELGLGMSSYCKGAAGFTTLLGDITVSLQDMTQYQPFDTSGDTTGIDMVADAKYGLDTNSQVNVNQVSDTEYTYQISGSQLTNRNIGCASVRTHSNLDVVSKDWWCNCWTTGDTTWAVMDLRKS